MHKILLPNKWCCLSMPLLLHSRCPKAVQISGMGTRTRLSYAQTHQTADLQTNTQSRLSFHSWNKVQRSEMLFSCFMAGLFTVGSVCFYIIKLRTPKWCLPKWHLGFSVRLGKAWRHIAVRNCYVFEVTRPLNSFLFQTIHLKRQTGIWEPIHSGHFVICRLSVLSPI
jgi:hypothetical protein